MGEHGLVVPRSGAHAPRAPFSVRRAARTARWSLPGGAVPLLFLVVLRHVLVIKRAQAFREVLVGVGDVGAAEGADADVIDALDGRGLPGQHLLDPIDASARKLLRFRLDDLGVTRAR